MRNHEPMPLEDRYALIWRAQSEGVTLNGVRATIGGARNQFASVRQLPNGLGCEWAWETVAHILNNRNGEFHS